MKKITLVIIGFFALFVPFFAFAQSGTDAPDALVPRADMFRFAPDVRIESPVSRDAIVAGGSVIVDESVAEDLLVLGGTVLVNAEVLGDARIAGGTVVIDAPISGNVAIVGDDVTFTEQALIGGSVSVFASHVAVYGDITGAVHVRAKTYTQTGSVAGNVVVETQTIIFGENARIDGYLHYESNEQLADTVQNQIAGGVVFTPAHVNEQTGVSIITLMRMLGLFGMLVVGLLLVSVFPVSVRAMVARTMERPARDFAWGIGILCIAPLVGIVLAFTLIGAPLALLMLAVYVSGIYLAHIAVALVLGTYLLGAIRGKKIAQASSLLVIMVLGVVVVRIITAVPVVGTLISLVSVVWGVGMIAQTVYMYVKQIEQ